MMMDIVERLRRTELHHVWDDLEGKMVGKMFSANPDGPEAADEIDLLRDEVRILKTGLQNIKKCICHRGDEEDQRDHKDDFAYMVTAIIIALGSVRE